MSRILKCRRGVVGPLSKSKAVECGKKKKQGFLHEVITPLVRLIEWSVRHASDVVNDSEN